jgi:hypothetical protein
MRLPVVLFGLIGFDLLRVRRSFEAVLGRWQDRVTLAFMAAFVLLAGAGLFGGPATIAVTAPAAALAAFLLAASAGAAKARRLEALAERSIVAPLALSRPARAAYLALFATGLLAFALAAARAAGFGIDGAGVPPAILLAWMGGAVFGVLASALWRLCRPGPARDPRRPDASPRGSPAGIALRSQFPILPPGLLLGGACAAGAAQALAIGATMRMLNPWAGGVLAVAAALATLFAFARVPAGACRFGAFAGVPPGRALVACLIAPGAAALGAVLGALSYPPLPWLELGCGLAVAVVAAIRLLHYRRYERIRADRLMQAQILFLALAAAVLPPLALLLVAVRAATLWRADRRALWASF